MKILAITCATGGTDHAEMTGDMLRGLAACVPRKETVETSVVLQGCSHELGFPVNFLTFHPHNVGFAFGMNLAIQAAAVLPETAPDFVLCLNNDLQFPHKNWLRKLIDIAEQAPHQVIVPATDSAAIRTQPGPRELPSFPTEESSAYAWLIPFAWCKWLKETHGFWLFDEDFKPAYGEDNWTAFLLSKQFGEKVFRYVPRSFVKHLRARTSRIVEHNRRESNRTLVDKLNGELKDPNLRTDLRRWAQRYVAILSTRL